ncbi:DUF1385 domain-containing protein [Thermodesulfobacteriota bacterium]
MMKAGMNVGGQAVIEGVLMRAPRSLSIVVRRQNGRMIVKLERLKLLSDRFKAMRLPILRGVVSLFSMLTMGIQALTYSANKAYGDDEEEKSGELSPLGMGLTVTLGLAFGIGLFFVLPLFLTKLLKSPFAALEESNLLFNLVDGVIRIVIFLLYLWGINFIKDIKRVFQYHGAEHKSIYAFEAGEELSVENARRFSKLHPRCGTNFLLTVMVISILIFSLIPPGFSFLWKAAARIVLIPLIAGISYELIKLSDKNQDYRIVRWMSKPGLWLQSFTTREPDDDQIEVALCALREAVRIEEDTTLSETYTDEFTI